MNGLRRLCPYCGTDLNLDECAVIATGDAGHVPTSARGVFDASASDELGMDALDDTPGELADRPVASADAASARELWRPEPVGSQAARDERRYFGLGTLLRGGEPRLKSLDDFPPEKMARRACPECGSPLPVDLDERQLHILAIAGLNSVGKTHYLAAAMTQASRQRGLADLGCTEFQADPETASVLHQQYYTPLFRNRSLLGVTQVDSDVRHRPLTFRVTWQGFDPLLLMTHDVSGEALSDHRLRATHAPFLRRASAMIFLVDPTEFDAIRDKLPAHETPPDRYIHQTDLLAACIRELQFMPGGLDVPVAVVISKADLLSAVLGRVFSFDTDGDKGPEWLDDVKRVSEEVKTLLLELGEHDLVQTAEAHPRVTFHAVSPLGGSPNGAGFAKAEPRRCMDPLGAVLVRLMRALAN